jgi:uncharacterized LabA/DUF88 family protein
MKKVLNNSAYIDGANLHTCANSLEWKLDYGKLRIWLKEKYAVQCVYLFLGFIPHYQNLYDSLKILGYELIFKEVIYDHHGKVKGNCDTDIVVHIMKDVYEDRTEKVILVSSDGDYASVVSFLLEKDRLEAILSPALPSRCSVLLKRTHAKIVYLDDQKSILRV